MLDYANSRDYIESHHWKGSPDQDGDLSGWAQRTNEMETAPVIHVQYVRETAGFRRLLRTRPSTLALAAGTALIALASWMAWWISAMPLRELPSTAALLGQAYTGRRTSELRLPGAYAPVRVRGRDDRSTFARPIALLEAESRIASRLAANPDDPDWLRLRARADMLDGDYEDAVSIMRRTVDMRPEDVSLLADLGAAYAMRAEGEHREIDYGAAIDTFWRVLRVRPDFPLAVFNRAVVYERMFLFDDARQDWGRYLQLDPNGGWAAEARGRRQMIERKMEARDQAAKSLASASGYLQAVKAGRAYDPEFYLDHAVMAWLPAAAHDASAREAVVMLAQLLREKHEDPWLEDLLKAKPDTRFWDATEHLAAAAKHNLADEAEGALSEARLAERDYRAAGVRAGVLRARYQEAYALFRAMQGKECLDVAGKLAGEAASLHYGWIESQSFMESGNRRAVTEIGEAAGCITNTRFPGRAKRGIRPWNFGRWGFWAPTPQILEISSRSGIRSRTVSPDTGKRPIVATEVTSSSMI